MSPEISERFAQQLLRALYRLDRPIGKLDGCLPDLPPGPREEVRSAIADLMGLVLNELMDPLYAAHPQLGTAADPGPWLGDYA
jgi:hypothetical protein